MPIGMNGSRRRIAQLGLFPTKAQSYSGKPSPVRRTAEPQTKIGIVPQSAKVTGRSIRRI